MTARLLLVLVLAVAGVVAPARGSAQPGVDPAATLSAAQDALRDGDYAAVLELVARIVEAPARADRAEAWRLRGLASYFLGDLAGAEVAFLDYLKLDLDGRLDPTLVPPEAVTFFEDVRSRHAAELRALRPRQKRYRVLNLVPVAGQLQNGETTKGLVIGGLELGLAVTNVTTYLVLRSWCKRDGFTCESDGGDIPVAGRRVRFANYASGIALIGVYAYGVWDAFRGHRRRNREQAAPVVSVVPMEGGVGLGTSLSF